MVQRTSKDQRDQGLPGTASSTIKATFEMGANEVIDITRPSGENSYEANLLLNQNPVLNGDLFELVERANFRGIKIKQDANVLLYLCSL